MTPTPSRPTKAQRLLDLLAFLSSRRLPAGLDVISENVPGYALDAVAGEDEGTAPEAMRRRFERDKAELRDLGIPLETIPPRAEADAEARYLLRPDDFYLPVLRFLAAEDAERGASELEADGAAAAGGTGAGKGRRKPPGSGRRIPEMEVRSEELRAAVESLFHVQDLPGFPLRREARSALAKLTFDLASETDGAAPQGLGEATRVLHLPAFDPVTAEPILTLASDALRRRKTLRFDYYSIGRDRTERRETHPLGLLYQGSRWYLLAQDLHRGAPRLFRVDRMESVEVESRRPRSPDYEIPPEHSLAELRRRQAWDLGGEEVREVRVRFDLPLALLASRNEWGEPLEGGVRLFRVRAVEPFLRWLLTHWGAVEVVDPDDVRERLEALRRRTLEAHL